MHVITLLFVGPAFYFFLSPGVMLHSSLYNSFQQTDFILLTAWTWPPKRYQNSLMACQLCWKLRLPRQNRTQWSRLVAQGMRLSRCCKFNLTVWQWPKAVVKDRPGVIEQKSCYPGVQMEFIRLQFPSQTQLSRDLILVWGLIEF